MHVLIINFRLADMDEEGYRAACAEMAPAFAELLGLLAKVWLAPADGTYGGVYLFRDRESMEGYLASELFATVAAFRTSRTSSRATSASTRTSPGSRSLGLTVVAPVGASG